MEKGARSSLSLWSDIVACNYKYNIGLMDYFLFRFFEKDDDERSRWVGTGYKYEYDLVMNPKSTRHILENKADFYEAYKPLVRHETCLLRDLEENSAKARTVLHNPTGKVVVKDALSQCGWDVEVLTMSQMTLGELIGYMKQRRLNLVEEFIVQHPELARLSPSGLNTVRMITQLSRSGGVDFLGARLRISVGGHVDNLASGNIAAPVDLATGIVCGPAVYSDITMPSVDRHPITGVAIVGFQIPFWQEVVDLARRGAEHRPENRSIGWDIAVTAAGPEFIEGNHNWCKILWQLPVNQGLKHVLEKYLE
jgi:hypothetical protein